MTIQLNRAFLEECGLGAVPEHAQDSLLDLVTAELEQRVGRELSDGMSEAQLLEFEGLVDCTPEAVLRWSAAHPAGETQTALHERAASGDRSALAELADFSCSQWLEVNRPDYRAIVVAAYERLRDALRADAPRLLARFQA